MNTDELIANLSNDTKKVRTLPSPVWLWFGSVVFMTLYGVVLLNILGIRPDIIDFASQTLIMVELSLMIVMIASSLWFIVCSTYPDQHQQRATVRLPYLCFILLVGVLGVQVEQMNMTKMVEDMPHHIECFSCIAWSTILPAIGAFVLTQMGATTTPVKSGSIALLAASGISALALRLAEVTNDIMHLLVSHYVPILLFAAIGVFIGQRLLKW